MKKVSHTHRIAEKKEMEPCIVNYKKKKKDVIIYNKFPRTTYKYCLKHFNFANHQ